MARKQGNNIKPRPDEGLTKYRNLFDHLYRTRLLFNTSEDLRAFLSENGLPYKDVSQFARNENRPEIRAAILVFDQKISNIFGEMLTTEFLVGQYRDSSELYLSEFSTRLRQCNIRALDPYDVDSLDTRKVFSFLDYVILDENICPPIERKSWESTWEKCDSYAPIILLLMLKILPTFEVGDGDADDNKYLIALFINLLEAYELSRKDNNIASFNWQEMREEIQSYEYISRALLIYLSTKFLTDLRSRFNPSDFKEIQEQSDETEESEKYDLTGNWESDGNTESNDLWLQVDPEGNPINDKEIWRFEQMKGGFNLYRFILDDDATHSPLLEYTKYEVIMLPMQDGGTKVILHHPMDIYNRVDARKYSHYNRKCKTRLLEYGTECPDSFTLSPFSDFHGIGLNCDQLRLKRITSKNTHSNLCHRWMKALCNLPRKSKFVEYDYDFAQSFPIAITRHDIFIQECVLIRIRERIRGTGQFREIREIKKNKTWYQLPRSIRGMEEIGMKDMVGLFVVGEGSSKRKVFIALNSINKFVGENDFEKFGIVRIDSEEMLRQAIFESVMNDDRTTEEESISM